MLYKDRMIYDTGSAAAVLTAALGLAEPGAIGRAAARPITVGTGREGLSTRLSSCREGVGA